jgi:hypothetical protein
MTWWGRLAGPPWGASAFRTTGATALGPGWTEAPCGAAAGRIGAAGFRSSGSIGQSRSPRQELSGHNDKRRVKPLVLVKDEIGIIVADDLGLSVADDLRMSVADDLMISVAKAGSHAG